MHTVCCISALTYWKAPLFHVQYVPMKCCFPKKLLFLLTDNSLWVAKQHLEPEHEFFSLCKENREEWRRSRIIKLILICLVWITMGFMCVSSTHTRLASYTQRLWLGFSHQPCSLSFLLRRAGPIAIQFTLSLFQQSKKIEGEARCTNNLNIVKSNECAHPDILLTLPSYDVYSFASNTQ